MGMATAHVHGPHEQMEVKVKHINRSMAGLVLALAWMQASGAEEIIEEVIVVGTLEETIPLELARYGNRIKAIAVRAAGLIIGIVERLEAISVVIGSVNDELVTTGAASNVGG